jgi:hypothetical protein
MPNYSKLFPLAKGALTAEKSLGALTAIDPRLAKFLKDSKTQMRLYHGTTATEGGKGKEAIRQLKPSKEGALGSGAYMTPKADFAGSYAEELGGNVLPVYAQLKNPLIIKAHPDPERYRDPMIEALTQLGMDENKAANMVERAYDQQGYIGKQVQSRAQAQGYDGLMQYDRNGDLSEVVSYNPSAIKSAIGNEGTYDTSIPHMGKAGGGEVNKKPNDKNLKDKIDDILLMALKVPLSPLGNLLSAGYAGYKYATKKDPLADFQNELFDILNPEYDTGTIPMGKAGGGLAKGVIGALTKVGKGMQPVLPIAERDANLAKMLESSAIKNKLYHGTGRDIQKFDKSKLRRTAFGEGFHLAESPNLANFYANQFDEGQNVMPVYAAIKNPYELKSMHDWYDIPGANDTEKTNLLKSQGYDGIKYPHGAGDDKTSPSPNVYVAFEPEQIKSAISNRGTYDINEADISKAGGGSVIKGIIGAMTKAADIPKPAQNIIIPSRISDLKEIVRQSKGDYGARRVERAADEIPNLEKMYKDEALNRAFTGDNAKALMTMNPADFEKYSIGLPIRTVTEPKSFGDKTRMSTEDYLKYLRTLPEGFDDVPYLNLYKNEIGIPSKPLVSGHEGRHRSRALASRGEPNSLVQLNPGGDLREGMPRRSQEDFIEALKKELERSNRLVTPESDVISPRPPVELPDIYADGGGVHMQVGGLGALAKLGRAGTKLSKLDEAALNARKLGIPGVDFADPLMAPDMRMSEALGASGSEGKFLNFTEADRSRVFGPNRGGVGFSGLQLYSEPHQKANTVWGFGNKTTAQKKINQNNPENTVWTTYAGSPEQHKSNTVVVKDAVNTLQEANKAGAVNPEQINLINKRIQEAVNDKGAPLFSESFDITDPQAMSEATTFERRTAISDALMGIGVKKPMKSKEFQQANPNVKWRDASNISGILTRETDPVLVGANTYDVGPHLFTMDNGIIERPDLNEAFPTQVTGTDFGLRFKPAPFRSAAPDFIQKKGYGPTDAINAWAMSRGIPQQFVSEAYLKQLQKEGYKEGGAITNDWVNKFHKALTAHGAKGMAGGGATHKESSTQNPTEPDQPRLTHQQMEEMVAAHKAAFGQYPQMTGKRSKQDKEAAKNMPLAALRSWGTSTAGLPGDIEGIGRQILLAAAKPGSPMSGISETSALPTSEFYNEYFPLADESPAGKLAGSLGSLAGGVGSTKLAGAGLRGAKAVGKEVAREVAKGMEGKGALSRMIPKAVRPMNVVKPEGGNWLSGSVEQALNSLKIKTATNSDPAVTLAELRKKFPPEEIEKVTKTVPNFAANIANNFAELERQAALNKWVDSNLTGYVKKKMGTPSDPVRKLAEEGITHMPNNEIDFANQWVPEELAVNRMKAGYPTQGVGQSNFAKGWEAKTDDYIHSAPASEYTKPLTESEIRRGMKSVVSDNPWLNKLDPNVPVTYLKAPDALPSDLGFDHIMDVLRQDVTEGRIRPEQLSKVSMEQAVQRTYEFDQEMAKRMRETDFKATEGMPIHKDYGEEGYRWVELAPDKNLPEGWKKEESGLYTGPNGEQSIYHPNYSKLSEALKYEGDTMGHCVGSYCPDVWEGKSRIYSLRDAKNQPHITVETEPQNPSWSTAKNSGADALLILEEAKQRMGLLTPEMEKEALNLLNADERYAKQKELDKHFADIYKEKYGNALENILQIKGKQNAPPVDKYLPYAQDFVKSGKWNEVDDLENAGMIKNNPEAISRKMKANQKLDEYGEVSMEERLRAATEAHSLGKFDEFGKYLTPEEYEPIFLKYLRPSTDEGLKNGGMPHLMAELQSKMQQFRRELVH